MYRLRIIVPLVVSDSFPSDEMLRVPCSSNCLSCPQIGFQNWFRRAGAPRRKRNSVVPELNNNSSPLSAFLLYFAEIITLVVLETNSYYRDHLDRVDERPSPQPDVTEAEMPVFLAITIEMGNCRLLVKVLQFPHNVLR